MRRSNFAKSFSDLALVAQPLYARLLRRIVDGSLVTDLGDVIQQVGLFTVAKKASGKQRLVTYARGVKLRVWLTAQGEAGDGGVSTMHRTIRGADAARRVTRSTTWHFQFPCAFFLRSRQSRPTF